MIIGPDTRQPASSTKQPSATDTCIANCNQNDDHDNHDHDDHDDDGEDDDVADTREYGSPTDIPKVGWGTFFIL